MKIFCLLFVAGCTQSLVVADPTFHRRVDACNNSASCNALVVEAQTKLNSYNCKVHDCSELIQNYSASKSKLDLIKKVEDSSSQLVEQETRRLQKERELDLKNKEYAEKQDALELTKQFCEETKAERNRSLANYARYTEIFNSNKEWVGRNCRKTQTYKTVCATNSSSGKTICRQEDLGVVLNCGSNQRPLKMDGTKLNDTDILQNNFALEASEAQDLLDEKKRADNSEYECAR